MILFGRMVAVVRDVDSHLMAPKKQLTTIKLI